MFLKNCWNICGILLLITLINVNSLAVNNDQCLNYCSNGGVCAMVENKPTCYCLPKWEGERCDIVTPFPKTYQLDRKANLRASVPSPLCAYVPDLCSNKGVCFLDDQTKKLACQCPYPYAGLFCTEFSVCKDYCYNNGICEVQSDLPVCVNCGDSYTGARCQSIKTTTTAVPPTTTTNVVCAALPSTYCNKGTCTGSQTGAPVCRCPSGYSGTRCEVSSQGPGPGPIIPGTLPPGPIVPGVTNPPIVGGNACATNPCRNGRPCYNTGNTFYCLCGSLYQGTYCENYVG